MPTAYVGIILQVKGGVRWISNGGHPTPSRATTAGMDVVRQRIVERLQELGRSQSWLSQQLGRNRAYVYQYLVDGSPRDLPLETKIKIAQLLGVSVSDLGVDATTTSMMDAAPPGFSEGNSEPFIPPKGHLLSPSATIGYFRMKSSDLDQHPDRIMPGDLLAFDLAQARPSAIASGKIVVAQLYDRADLTRSHGTLICQFIAPNKLVSNSSGANWIRSIDDANSPFEPVIKGVLLSILREMN